MLYNHDIFCFYPLYFIPQRFVRFFQTEFRILVFYLKLNLRNKGSFIKQHAQMSKMFFLSFTGLKKKS